MIYRTLALGILSFVVSTIAIAQNRSEFRAVLIPVYDSGPGAFGAIWSSQLEIYNDSDQEAEFAGFVYVAPCNLGAPCPAHIPPKTVVPFAYGANQVTGFLIYEPKSLGSRLHYHLRIRDQSRHDTAFGTEIPVVFEDQFRHDEFFLLSVPVGEGHRQTLRIYSLAVDPPQVLVRIFTQPNPTHQNFSPKPQLLRQEFFHLSRPPGPRMDDPIFPLRPSFAPVPDLGTQYPELKTQDRVMIGVSSLMPGVPVWAFVSVTDNATQHVTTITPQPPRH